MSFRHENLQVGGEGANRLGVVPSGLPHYYALQMFADLKITCAKIFKSHLKHFLHFLKKSYTAKVT